MSIARLFRHVLTSKWEVSRILPAASLDRIEKAIAESESRHAGEIRFAVESALEPVAVWRGQTAHERALEVFSRLRVWDTEHNDGVLIYLLLADHDVEIVADRGIHGLVGTQCWEAICREMEAAFREGRFEQGIVGGIGRVSRELEKHFPHGGGSANELPDQPAVL